VSRPPPLCRELKRSGSAPRSPRSSDESAADNDDRRSLRRRQRMPLPRAAVELAGGDDPRVPDAVAAVLCRAVVRGRRGRNRRSRRPPRAFARSGPLAAGILPPPNAGPGVVAVRQALLARHDTEGAVVWYPPGRLTLWVAGLGIGGIGVALLLLGGPESLQAT